MFCRQCDKNNFSSFEKLYQLATNDKQLEAKNEKDNLPGEEGTDHAAAILYAPEPVGAASVVAVNKLGSRIDN